MLRKAFDKGETFAVGINTATGREGIIWNGIEHKTKPRGGGRYAIPNFEHWPEFLPFYSNFLCYRGMENISSTFLLALQVMCIGKMGKSFHIF